jgi:signal transduction histidine kinase
VLVVEDDVVQRDSIVAVLREGVVDTRIDVAATGAEAMAILQAGGVDLLLADVRLPDLDGRDLGRRLRDLPGGSQAYVILITGAISPDELFAAIDAGVDDCLMKPLRADELVVRVRAGLRRVGTLRGLSRRLNRSEQLYSRQTEFLSTVSHEIRTPLSAILSAANVLLRYGGKRPDTVERFARVIHEEGQRLTRLINNLLDLAKIEAGEVEWHFVGVPVEELAEQVVQTLSELARERGVALRVEAGPPVGRPQVDRDRITQVMVNLVSNAIKHSPADGVVALRLAPSEGGGVRLEVEDEGDGIPPGMEEQVFTRFHQLTGEDRRTGTGLGLTISREIVDRHGGRIFAAPGRARGALFVVELPATSPRPA